MAAEEQGKRRRRLAVFPIFVCGSTTLGAVIGAIVGALTYHQPGPDAWVDFGRRGDAILFAAVGGVCGMVAGLTLWALWVLWALMRRLAHRRPHAH